MTEFHCFIIMKIEKQQFIIPYVGVVVNKNKNSYTSGSL